MKDIAEKLEAEMAKAVALIVTASHAAALETLNQAFGVDERPQKRSAEAGQSRHAPRALAAPRRDRAEIRALEEQLLREIWATPGESMSVLASRMGASASQLQVPVSRLKTARKLKTVGERQFMRYFPAERPAGDETKAADA